MRVNDELSDLSVTSTGSPQGCVLSPLLYIMYTNDCRSTYVNCHISKFADGMVIVSLLNKDEFSHGPVVDDFMTWRQDSFLVVNVSKTKDMPTDFRQSHPSPVSTVISGQSTELVESYKYSGTIRDNRVTFECHTDSVYKRSQQRLFCLRKFTKFQVDRTLMNMFSRSFIEPVLTFYFICWF